MQLNKICRNNKLLIMTPTEIALQQFTQRYITTWQRQTHNFPRSEELYGIDSPCIVRTDAEAIYWQAERQQPSKTLHIAETLINITIRPELHQFYGLQYAGDMHAQWQNQALTLIQAWNGEDFKRLEQNLIAHLQMQKRLKRQPTPFIASTPQDTQIIAVNNVTGEVGLEELISGEITVLCGDLPQFLSQLQVVVKS